MLCQTGPPDMLVHSRRRQGDRAFEVGMWWHRVRHSHAPTHSPRAPRAVVRSPVSKPHPDPSRTSRLTARERHGGTQDGSLPQVWVSQLSLIKGSSPEGWDCLAITPASPAPAASLARSGGGKADEETLTSGSASAGVLRGCWGEVPTFPAL